MRAGEEGSRKQQMAREEVQIAGGQQDSLANQSTEQAKQPAVGAHIAVLLTNIFFAGNYSLVKSISTLL